MEALVVVIALLLFSLGSTFGIAIGSPTVLKSGCIVYNQEVFCKEAK